MADDLTAAGGWCAPSRTLYDLGAAVEADRLMAGIFAPATCPSVSPASATACTLPDRLDRHDAGHRAPVSGYSIAWLVTDAERARWTHDCPRPDPEVAWATLRALGRDPDDAVPCSCGATWSLSISACSECMRADGPPTWYRWPPEGGAWDGTFSIAREGIRFPIPDVEAPTDDVLTLPYGSDRG